MMNDRILKCFTLCRWTLLWVVSTLFMNPSTHAQETLNILVDTSRVRTIPLEKIPLASGEDILNVTQIAKSLVTKEQIDLLNEENEKIMREIDSVYNRQRDIDLSLLNYRNLKNMENSWIGYKIQVQKMKDNLSGMIKSINEKQKTLNELGDLWVNTKDDIASKDSGSSAIVIIDKVSVIIDSVNSLVLLKTNEMITILNKASLWGLDIEGVLSRINGINQDRQAHIMAKTELAIWQIKFSGEANWQIRKYIQLFNETDLILMKNYYQKNRALFIFYLVYLVLLIFLFRYLNQLFKRVQKELTTQYEDAVRKLLSKPVSAALILGLFSSVLLFVNRPLIMTDLLVLVVAFPLISIVSTISTNFRDKYAYLFGLIILLRFINYIFPPEIMPHRLILLIMGIFEVVFFLALMRYVKELDIKKPWLKIITKLILILHISAACIGIAANIFGSVLMADSAINIVVVDTFAGFLIFISVVILIGLIHFALDSKYLMKLNFIRNYSSILKSYSAGLILFIGLISWLISVIKAMGMESATNDFFKVLLTTRYKLGAGTFTIGSILLFFFVIWLSVTISKIVRVILEEEILDRMPLKKGVPRMISVMTRYTLIVMGVFVAVSLAGMSLSSLTIILGAFSVGIGFGLQNIFNNLVSGLILLFERPIQIGDVIEVGQLLGNVKSMGIRSSNLRTFDGAEVIVPNGHLISNEVINWTLSDKRRRIEILSGVAYGSDVHKVHALFMNILDEHPDVLKNPAPMVYFNNLGESSLDFRLLFWTDDFDNWVRIRSEVIFRIYDVLNEEGIQIPFPQRDVHIKSGGGTIKA